MNTDEPRKELKPEELLTAMIGKTIRIVKFTAANLLAIEFTDGTEVELKTEIPYCGELCDLAIVGYSPVYMNSRDIANMPQEKDCKSLKDTFVEYEKKFPFLHGPFFKIDPQSNFAHPPD